MAEAKIHDDYLVMISEDVRGSLIIGETIDFVGELEKVVSYPKRGNVASVRRLHGMIEHNDTIDEEMKDGYAMMMKRV